jgi:hypothetical protein
LPRHALPRHSDPNPSIVVNLPCALLIEDFLRFPLETPPGGRVWKRSGSQSFLGDVIERQTRIIKRVVAELRYMLDLLGRKPRARFAIPTVRRSHRVILAPSSSL